MRHTRPAYDPKRILTALLLAFWASFSPAHATTLITPSDRVTTRLNVREEPTAGSPVVGKLDRNETAELLASIPYWYQIRLFNGVEGYVGKAWANEVTRPEVPESRIRLGAWNIKKVGHGSSKDYHAVATVIEQHFDVVAVVEVMQKQQGHPGYDSLLGTMGAGWRGIVTPTPRPNDPSLGHAEFYAVMYRGGVVRPCEGWDSLRIYDDNDGSGSGIGPDLFAREPAVGCFQAGFADNSPAHGVDFLLAAYHARWEDGDEDAIKAEVGHIAEVVAAMQAWAPDEKDLVVVGDFNLNPEPLSGVVPYTDRTIGTGSTLNSAGERTSNLYDHLLICDEAASGEFIGDARVLDVREVAETNQVFYGTVSDHLPIVIEVVSSGPDDD